jgi:hypothetical protein
MKCIGGRATACVGGVGGCNLTTEPSSGYATAYVEPGRGGCYVDPQASDAFFSASAPELFQACNVQRFSFFVKSTCEVTISSMNDSSLTANGLACSSPGNAAAQVTAYYVGVDRMVTKPSAS